MAKKKSKFTINEISLNAYSKAEYARKINVSQTWINELIKTGELIEIKFNGGSFVYPKTTKKNPA
jgi:hypothetical protein